MVDLAVFSTVSSVQGAGSGISLFADKQFDEAYNITQIENNLPHVRWGRVDYMNVTYITTKWAVWKCVIHKGALPPTLTVAQCTYASCRVRQRANSPILARHPDSFEL